MSSSSSEGDPLDHDGWDDVEDDTVEETFVSLFDDEKFQDLTAMFEYCKAKYSFDIWHMQKRFELDFISLVKLVNYVRRSVSEGQAAPDVSSKAVFDDDRYLLPYMGDDAVLYNLEDVLAQARSPAQSRIEELEDQLAALQVRFDAYRKDVTEYLGENFEPMPAKRGGSSIMQGDRCSNGKQGTMAISDDAGFKGSQDHDNLSTKAKEGAFTRDDDYFQSYSFNDIHEAMLKDTVRTDAYRDFIYESKHLFRDKIVLDVGCGTGVLSMFCARAGAKQVFAVDNSSIIDMARQIVKDNGLQNQIQCIRGKIEEISLPVAKVDIIVSEWMGYGLLFESMLDSVIYARDRYLSVGGLMVPSHATLNVGLLADSEMRESCVEFWQDVYGFSMKPMAARAQEEAVIKVAQEHEISAGNSFTFRTLDLHRCSVADLSFEEPFKIVSSPNSETLDGFVIWFDIFFNQQPAESDVSLDWTIAKQNGLTAFTTGPFGQSTHWQQTICLIKAAYPGLKGKAVNGRVCFEKVERDDRALCIRIMWQVNSTTQLQSWYIR